MYDLIKRMQDAYHFIDDSRSESSVTNFVRRILSQFECYTTFTPRSVFSEVYYRRLKINHLYKTENTEVMTKHLAVVRVSNIDGLLEGFSEI